MEFHDILHGLIRVDDESLTPLLSDLLRSPEINRLRNMRQMNFDVPLIQELGRSRRLPHSIGVAHLAISLAHKSSLNVADQKVLMAAALLHDAAIPPYGHLVESEFKKIAPSFKHEEVLKDLINATITQKARFTELVPNHYHKVFDILEKHEVDSDKVISLACPDGESPISADIDIDNIDNIHRMAAMLGWSGAKENLQELMSKTRLNGLSHLEFDEAAQPNLEKWLDMRQRIYTMIIAHPECIPHNALQTDLVRMAINEKIITPEHWYLTEPQFEMELMRNARTQDLAHQLISGCEYHVIDYVWIKDFDSIDKKINAEIAAELDFSIETNLTDTEHFVWVEKGLISRKIKWRSMSGDNLELGRNSRSCLIALVKRTPGGGSSYQKKNRVAWRADIEKYFSSISQGNFSSDYIEDYSGNFYSVGTNELKF